MVRKKDEEDMGSNEEDKDSEEDKNREVDEEDLEDGEVVDDIGHFLVMMFLLKMKMLTLACCLLMKEDLEILKVL